MSWRNVRQKFGFCGRAFGGVWLGRGSWGRNPWAFWGGGNNDTLKGGAGRDTLEGYDGDDRLEGEGDSDTLHGNAGNDTLIAGDGSDRVYGDAGNDLIDLGSGSDYGFGWDGDDVFESTLDGVWDRIDGGNGYDSIMGFDRAGDYGVDDTIENVEYGTD
ncbi:MAG: hypothetical protein NTU53_03180 [Planctomycetota bacterium]|nr:hypothetical protein [Planctomycetota bacterium]